MSKMSLRIVQPLLHINFAYSAPRSLSCAASAILKSHRYLACPSLYKLNATRNFIVRFYSTEYDKTSATDFGNDQTKKESDDTAKTSNNKNDDPFKSSDTTLNYKAHLLADGKADSRHFMYHGPEKETSMIEPIKGALHFQEEAQHVLPHPVWSDEALSTVQITHFPPENITDRLAYIAVKSLRTAFDITSGYSLGRIDERGWLNRVVFLETVAGVPGMVGAMIRHLNSLRRMERDYGWIHTLLEEAENERMHLMTALVLKKPTLLFRTGVLLTQGFFLLAYTTSYILSRHFCHRFVGYLEEEAVITYTKMIKEMDSGHLPLFESLPAPPVAKDYWCLDDNANFRDVILAIRADESHHREVNHTFAGMPYNAPNPFPPGH